MYKKDTPKIAQNKFCIKRIGAVLPHVDLRKTNVDLRKSNGDLRKSNVEIKLGNVE